MRGRLDRGMPKRRDRVSPKPDAFIQAEESVHMIFPLKLHL